MWTGEQLVPWVDVHHAATTEAVLRHLHSRGHRRIAVLGCLPGPGVAEERVFGWRRACRALGLPGGERLEARVANGIAGGRAGAARLLELAPRPTAVVAVSDELAMGALHAIADLGLRAGPDVAVTGVGDSAACTAVRPTLTTVRLPVEEMAGRAVRMLDGAGLPMLAGSPGLLLAPQLIVRDSTPPPGAP